MSPEGDFRYVLGATLFLDLHPRSQKPLAPWVEHFAPCVPPFKHTNHMGKQRHFGANLGAEVRVAGTHDQTDLLA